MATATFTPKSVLNLALVAVCAASLAACASRPKPEPAAPTPPPAPAVQPDTTPAPPMPPAPQGPVAGSEQDFVINVGDRVYFDLDSYTIRDDAAPVLDAQAAWLNRYPDVTVRIEGNADERGTREYNLGLGSRRANSIRDYLVNRGVASSRIATISYGKEKPIDPGTTEEAYQRNRNGRTALVSGAR